MLVCMTTSPSRFCQKQLSIRTLELSRWIFLSEKVWSLERVAAVRFPPLSGEANVACDGVLELHGNGTADE